MGRFDGVRLPPPDRGLPGETVSTEGALAPTFPHPAAPEGFAGPAGPETGSSLDHSSHVPTRAGSNVVDIVEHAGRRWGRFGLGTEESVAYKLGKVVGSLRNTRVVSATVRAAGTVVESIAELQQQQANEANQQSRSPHIAPITRDSADFHRALTEGAEELEDPQQKVGALVLRRKRELSSEEVEQLRITEEAIDYDRARETGMELIAGILEANYFFRDVMTAALTSAIGARTAEVATAWQQDPPVELQKLVKGVSARKRKEEVFRQAAVKAINDCVTRVDPELNVRIMEYMYGIDTKEGQHGSITNQGRTAYTLPEGSVGRILGELRSEHVLSMPNSPTIAVNGVDAAILEEGCLIGRPEKTVSGKTCDELAPLVRETAAILIQLSDVAVTIQGRPHSDRFWGGERAVRLVSALPLTAMGFGGIQQAAKTLNVANNRQMPDDVAVGILMHQRSGPTPDGTSRLLGGLIPPAEASKVQFGRPALDNQPQDNPGAHELERGSGGQQE